MAALPCCQAGRRGGVLRAALLLRGGLVIRGRGGLGEQALPGGDPGGCPQVRGGRGKDCVLIGHHVPPFGSAGSASARGAGAARRTARATKCAACWSTVRVSRCASAARRRKSASSSSTTRRR